ncbi:myosin light chain kinase 2, skeletal/cardiac muscle [Salminus brasiliensis]|uniref:myosin light chain kinase 2, skeletal/cardiac muscle n=1 Tax=Salminus brasiliensis TaxID=930266 RepID=UPI003B8371D4
MASSAQCSQSMHSVRWPATRAHDPATLEAKMDDLHRKLDQLLSRSAAGGCPMCGICSHHSKQQQTTASQLSAQARLLDSLERKVAEVRTALEDLASGLEERSTDRMSVPAFALQRRKSLPVRTSVDEVYVRLDLPREKTKQNAFNVLSGKGQTGVLIEDSELEGLKGEGLINREVKDQHEPQPHKEGSGGKAGSAHTSSPPLLKPGTAATGPTSAGPTLAGGIQIRISPAAAERSTTQTKTPPKTPPKTCLKMIDDVPPQQAPFPHRCVSLRPSSPCDPFSINTREVLGGGRFGKVHRCTDNKTGLRLAAKIISARGAKEREMALNEIQVMNQLSHSNILQLYDAFEAKNQVVLILEYVEGGELFERIVDENCPLTEVDAMVFVKQICEGVQYMHQMYVLHLDLKPENILCVNRSGHQIKIIDFGLARRYKPREKLRVSFGTPEFLAPEVVNFDFVSFPTDMWTLGVVTYMLLSGLSPFLGDDDSQTLNNVLTVNWYFDEDAFEHVSDEAKDFVSNLLIKERSGRLSATQCLKHAWLNNISEKAKCSNIVLKSQVLLKKYMARRLWKKNYIAIAAANRFKKISSSGSLTSIGV